MTGALDPMGSTYQESEVKILPQIYIAGVGDTVLSTYLETGAGFP
jgi:hypothetical protein